MSSDEELSLVYPKPNAGGYSIVVLDRIVEGETPSYCIHGRATCMGECGEWVWLGSETVNTVRSGASIPLCRQCAATMIPPESRMPVGHIDDHRRADGPH